MNLFGRENHYYHASIRRYVALFGSLFTDLYIKRTAEDGSKEEFVKVPIKYGVGNMYVKVDQDVNTREDNKVARILPAMAFELSSIYKDVSRKTNPMIRIQETIYDADGKKKFQFNRIPYTLVFDLMIRTKNVDDMLQIAEQIIPAFDGNLSVTLTDSAGLAIEQDIVIKLEEIETEDNYDDEMKSRLVEWTITFEMKGYLHKKTIEDYIIKEVDITDSVGGEPVIVTNNPIKDTMSVATTMKSVLEGLTGTEPVLKTRKNRKKKVE